MWKAFFQQKLLWSRMCVVNWWGFQIGLRIALWGWMRMNGWMCVCVGIDRCWLGCCVELPFPAMISWIFLALAGGCWSLQRKRATTQKHYTETNNNKITRVLNIPYTLYNNHFYTNVKIVFFLNLRNIIRTNFWNF